MKKSTRKRFAIAAQEELCPTKALAMLKALARVSERYTQVTLEDREREGFTIVKPRQRTRSDCVWQP